MEVEEFLQNVKSTKCEEHVLGMFETLVTTEERAKVILGKFKCLTQANESRGD